MDRWILDVLKSALLDWRNSGFGFVGSVCRAAATSDRKTMENKKSGRLFRSNIGLTLCGHARDFMDKLSLEKDLAPFYKSTTRHVRDVLRIRTIPTATHVVNKSYPQISLQNVDLLNYCITDN